MTHQGIQSSFDLDNIGITDVGNAFWNLSPAQLVEHTLRNGQGQLADNGALCVDTGAFTGRSPRDKFVVADGLTEGTVWWGEVNHPISPAHFDRLLTKMRTYLKGRDLFVRDVYAGADPAYRIGVRVVNLLPWQNLFVNDMFIRPQESELVDFEPDWTVIAAPELCADPETDGTRAANFSIINFSEKIILIGGSGYTGEIKKGIFTVMNYLLPFQQVLPMHCSANVGEAGDTAIFFGLSGTGKTTLSADPNRQLIGDDEHAWTDQGVFNFEGGCYAKCIDLTPEQEPQIWNAIRHGALVENTRFFEGTRKIDFANVSVTQNTRVAYPLDHIEGALSPSVGQVPEHIFFLTCDAFGVLPPISKLTPGQAMYQFISGYTAKVAGTEEGVTEPQTVFSACFGEPFLPLHPTQYAEMLGEKIKESKATVWLINTGWSGGAYGTGSRMKLAYTRAMIEAALSGNLQETPCSTDPVFGLQFPIQVEGVPGELLNPRNAWADKIAYDEKAMELAMAFERNFKQYDEFATSEMREAAPRMLVK